jgi:hypothetical protein
MPGIGAVDVVQALLEAGADPNAAEIDSKLEEVRIFPSSSYLTTFVRISIDLWCWNCRMPIEMPKVERKKGRQYGEAGAPFRSLANGISVMW